jgi:DNA polymerase-3 subunit alpha
MTQADHLRRAMSKKIPEVMEAQRRTFVEGCRQASRIEAEEANRLFDLIDYFSGYGFNRSHSAAYALISYQTAYLKANFPVEFMCALMTCEKDNTDKVVEYVRESEQMGIAILPPDINESVSEFSVVSEKSIRFGLLAVKNVGELAIESMVAQRRSAGAFSSLYDFCQRVDLRLVNRKVLESLIKCGAFDGLKVYRSQLMAIVDKAIEMGTNAQREKAAGQFSFFDMGEAAGGFNKEMKTVPKIREWPQNQILAYEKEILGFYISGHPLNLYQMEMQEFSDCTTKDLKTPVMDGKEIKLIGIIKSVKLTTTRKTNERMAIIRVEDMEGEVEVVVFPSTYPNVAGLLTEGGVVVIMGKVGFRDDLPNIVAGDIKRIDEVYKTIKAINVNLSGVDEKGLQKLKDKLSKFPGKIPVYLKLDTNRYKSVQILVGEYLYVSPSEILMNEIKDLVGEDRFSVTL